MSVRRMAMSSCGVVMMLAAAVWASTGHELELPGLRGELPETWQTQPPTSPLRAAQASLPGSGGAAEMAAFFFGPGGGGDTEANITRWIRQIDSPTGQPVRDQFQVRGLTIKLVDVTGTLKASPMGVGPKTPQPNSRLLGAVVEGPGGPWFFKITGPDATVKEQHDTFLAFLKSLQAS